MADANMRIIITAVDNASAELGKIKTALNGVSGTGAEASESTKNLEKTSGSSFSKIAKYIASVTAAVYAMKKAYEFAEQGAQIITLRNTASNYANSLGGNFEQMVDVIRSSSMYTINELDAMQSASTAMMLGLGTDAEKLGQLVEVAAYRGRLAGLSTTEAFDQIVRGIGRMSPLILDNLGIVIDAENRYSLYAKQLGKTSTELTSTEKRQALLNGVIEETIPLIKKAGGVTAQAITPFEVLSSAAKEGLNIWKERMGGWADSLLGPMAALQQLGYLRDEGIITAEQFTEQYNKMFEAGYDYADVMNWVAQAVENYNATAIKGIAGTGQLKNAFIDTEISLSESQQTISDSIKSYGKYNDMLEQAWANSNLFSQAIQGMPSYKKIIIEIEYRIRGMAAEALRLYGQYYDWVSSGGSQSGKGVGLGTGTIPTTKPRALGGAVRTGEPYLIGELGPELFIPQDNGTIIPNNKMANVGGKNVTIHVTYAPTISTASESELEWALKPMIQRALREA